MPRKTRRLATSPEIYDAITIVSTPSELSRLQELLTKNGEAIWAILEQIPPEAVHYVRVRATANNHSKLSTYMVMIRSVVARALLVQKKRKPRPLPMTILANILQKSLDRNFTSKESLELILEYFEGFCVKYPAQKISPGEGEHILTNGEVIVLARCMKAMHAYIQSLSPIITGGHFTSRQRIQIKIFASIMEHLANIARWSNAHYSPYVQLCEEGQPFGPDRNGIGCEQFISHWKSLHHVFKNLKDSKNI